MEAISEILRMAFPTFVSTSLLFLCYKLFLQKEIRFQLNRFFLIGALLFSFILPMLNFNIVLHGNRITNDIVPLDEMIIRTLSTLEVNASQEVENDIPASLNFLTAITYIYIAGIAVSFLLFLIKLGHIVFLLIRSPKERRDGYVLVKSRKNIGAVSFFKYLIINEDDYSEDELRQIIMHEQKHVSQHHTWDLLLVEFATIIQWFNPFIYLYRNELRNVHEYIADSSVLQHGIEKSGYMSLILRQETGVEIISIGNNFSKSLTSKRINMMTKNKKSKFGAARILFAVPVIAGLAAIFCVTISCGIPDVKTEKNVEVTESIKYQVPDTVVAICDTPPEYKGGLDALYQYIRENIKYPQLAKDKNISGTVFAQFVVRKDGSISDVKILRGIDPECDAEVVRMLEAMPKWTPGTTDGKAVNVQFTLPVKFSLELSVDMEE